MAVKFIKACKLLNVPMSTLFDWCISNGYAVELDVNYQLSDELFARIEKQFGNDRNQENADNHVVDSDAEQSTYVVKEKIDNFSSLVHIENFELPCGSHYTGEAIMKFGMVDITGKGCSVNHDGSKYDGKWFGGRPLGFGTYIFADGDFHKGFFDDTPNGVGYLCLNTRHSMQIGIFSNGQITNGWAIGILPDGNFICSFLQNGKVIKDHTDDFKWMIDLLQSKVFRYYKGNMVQISSSKEYIRYGAPNRTGKRGEMLFERSAIGFTFANDGRMFVGMVNDIENLNGKLVACTPDHKIICGLWKNNELVKEEPMAEVDAYTDIQYTFESTKPLNAIEDSNLPF